MILIEILCNNYNPDEAAQNVILHKHHFLVSLHIIVKSQDQTPTIWSAKLELERVLPEVRESKESRKPSALLQVLHKWCPWARTPLWEHQPATEGFLLLCAGVIQALKSRIMECNSYLRWHPLLPTITTEHFAFHPGSHNSQLLLSWDFCCKCLKILLTYNGFWYISEVPLGLPTILHAL